MDPLSQLQNGLTALYLNPPTHNQGVGTEAQGASNCLKRARWAYDGRLPILLY